MSNCIPTSARIALALLISSNAYSAAIDFPPSASLRSNTIAANDAANGNIWTGVAQSFTALDSQVLFGFYTFEQTQVPTAVQFSLYAGDGTFASLLSQKSATLLSGTAFSPTLLSVDFSSTTLTINQKYTVAISLPGFALPAAGSYANVSVLYAGTDAGGDPNPYAGGTFYYLGSSYPPAFFFDRDIAFRVTAVPEPSTYSLLLSGLTLLIGAKVLRKHDSIA